MVRGSYRDFLGGLIISCGWLYIAATFRGLVDWLALVLSLAIVAVFFLGFLGRIGDSSVNKTLTLLGNVSTC